MDLLILAAGKGSRIYNNIGINKCLLKIKKTTLLKKIVNDAKSFKFINKIKVVVGFKKKKIFQHLNKKKIFYINNKDYAKKEMLHSLLLGLKYCNNDTIISYSDIYYSKQIFEIINKKKKNKILLPILKNWKKIWKIRNKNILEDCESLTYDKKLINLHQIYDIFSWINDESIYRSNIINLCNLNIFNY